MMTKVTIEGGERGKGSNIFNPRARSVHGPPHCAFRANRLGVHYHISKLQMTQLSSGMLSSLPPKVSQQEGVKLGCKPRAHGAVLYKADHGNMWHEIYF